MKIGTLKTIKAFKDWFIIKARNEGSEISVEETHQLLQEKEPVVLLDIREKEEIVLGYIKGATFLPQTFLNEKVEEQLPDKNVPVVVYCAGGIRSLAAAKLMKEKGYAHVFSMAKGIDGWQKAGYEVVSDSELTPDQLNRYSRHLMLKEVGMEGQLRLLKAKVLLVGAGGLGCPASLYLAAAGVGTIGIIDSDRVDLSNLQRQILHSTYDVGRPKTESAKDAIQPGKYQVELSHLGFQTETRTVEVGRFSSPTVDVNLRKIQEGRRKSIRGSRTDEDKIVNPGEVNIQPPSI